MISDGGKFQEIEDDGFIIEDELQARDNIILSK